MNEVMDFFGYPRRLAETLFSYSKDYFENVWKYFDNQSQYYSAGFYIIRQMSYSNKDIFTDKISKWLEEINGSCVDIGCGVGDYLIYLAKMGVKCTAVEHIGLPTEFLKWRFKRHEVDIPVLNSYNGDIYDYALLISSLDHIPSPEIFIRELSVGINKKIFATPCIDETYDRPTHLKEILVKVPEAFEVINEHNNRIENK